MDKQKIAILTALESFLDEMSQEQLDQLEDLIVNNDQDNLLIQIAD